MGRRRRWGGEFGTFMHKIALFHQQQGAQTEAGASPLAPSLLPLPLTLSDWSFIAWTHSYTCDCYPTTLKPAEPSRNSDSFWTYWVLGPGARILYHWDCSSGGWSAEPECCMYEERQTTPTGPLLIWPRGVTCSYLSGLFSNCADNVSRRPTVVGGSTIDFCYSRLQTAILQSPRSWM